MKMSLFQSKRFVLTLTLTMCCVAFSVLILGLAIAFNKAPNKTNTSAQYIYGNNSIVKLEVIDDITLEDKTINKLKPKIKVTSTGKQGEFGRLVRVTSKNVIFEYKFEGQTHSFTAVGPDISFDNGEGLGGGSLKVYISDIYDLGDFGKRVNKGENFSGITVLLDDDIGDEEKYMSMPIGTKSKPFAGTFDGQGHTISGYSMTPNILTNGNFLDSETIGATNYYYTGLFGYATGTIKNLKVTNAKASIATEGNNPWSQNTYNFIHGPVSNGNYVRVQNQGCPPTSAVVYAGLLAGYCNKIENCAIAGQLFCYIYTPGPNNTGWCSSSILAGGVVGQAKEINNCESKAFVQVSALDGVGNVLVGGIAGTCTKTSKSLYDGQIWYDGVLYYKDVAAELAQFCTATMVAIGGIVGGYRDGIESGGVKIESCISRLDLQNNDQHYYELSPPNRCYQHMNYIYSFNEIFGGGFNFYGLTWYRDNSSNPRYFYFDSSVFTYTNNYYYCYGGGYFSCTQNNQVNTKCGEYSTILK